MFNVEMCLDGITVKISLENSGDLSLDVRSGNEPASFSPANARLIAFAILAALGDNDD